MNVGLSTSRRQSITSFLPLPLLNETTIPSFEMQLLSFAVAALLSLSAMGAPTTPTPSLSLSSAPSQAPGTTTTFDPSTLSSSIIIDSSPLPVPTPVDHASCDRLVQQCAIDDANSPNGELRTAFSKTSCIIAFACRAPAKTVNDVLYDMWHSKGQYPTAIDEPRFSKNIFAQHSTDGKTWSQQNFIDTYYSKLSSIGGPYPSSVNVVISYWANIAAWTGFCKTKSIPFQNLADWYTYSSTVRGPSSTC